MRARDVALTLAILATCGSGAAKGEGTWEFPGPGAGTVPDARCVTERALYVGMADGDSGFDGVDPPVACRSATCSADHPGVPKPPC